MKIRTTLLLVMAVTIASFAAVSITNIARQNNYDRLNERAARIIALQHRIFEQSQARDEYIMFREERPKKQWFALNRDVHEHLAAMKKWDLGPDEKALLGKVEEFDNRIDVLFEKLITIDQGPASASSGTRELRERLIGQILVNAHSQYSSSLKLLNIQNQKVEVHHTRAHYYSIFTMGMFAAIVVVFITVIIRRITIPMEKLQEGAAVVARGDFSHRTGIRSRDEIGGLSRAFDAMTGNLKEVAISRDEYASVLSTSLDGFLIVDPAGRFVEINQAYCAMTGYDRDELLAMRLTDIEAAETAEDTARHTQKIMRSGGDRFETRHRRKDGSEIDLEVSVTYLNVKGGQFIAFVRDITGRKNAELAARQAAAQWQATFDATNSSFMLLDDQYRIIRANRATSGFLGLPLDEIIGKRCFELVHGAVGTSPECPCARLMSSLSHEESEIYLPERDRWVIETVDPILNDAGKLDQVVHIIDDITERKKAAIALIDAQRKFRDLLESINLIAVILDIKGNITFCNNFLLNLAGWKAEDVLGGNWFEVFLPEGVRGRARAVFEANITDGSRLHNENPVITRDGRLRNVVWDIAVLKDAQGSVTGTAGIGVDVTEHRRIEEQLRHAQKLEGIGQLAGGIAHDFNNVLSAVVGYAGMLQMSLDPSDPLRHHADEIATAGQRGAALTQQILAFSRRQVLDMQAMDLNDIVRGLEKMLRRLVREDITIEYRLAGRDLRVLADRGQIDQVMLNLATNASDAMLRGGRLGISTERFAMDEAYVALHGYGAPGDYALLSVTDTGTGMDAGTKERIFDPFFTTKEPGKGTGLGLAVVHGIVKQHNGYINVYSEPGRGTEFKIYLPLTEKAAQARAVADAEPVIGGTETILVAEDDDALRKLSATVLGRFGYTVIEAVDGEDAVRKFSEQSDRISLVVLDGIMPKRNGRQALEEIRKLRPGMKAVFQSGYSDVVFTREITADASAVLLQKPVRPSDLLRAVRRALDGT